MSDDDKKCQDAEDIKVVSDVEDFDFSAEYQEKMQPVIALVHEYCKANRIPHLFVAEMACESGKIITGHYKAHWGNISSLREMCLFISVQMITAKNQDEIGYRLGEILAGNPNALRMAFQAMEKHGVVVASANGLFSQTLGPSTTVH